VYTLLEIPYGDVAPTQAS